MQSEYIEIEKEQIPYEIEETFSDESFKLKINYNRTYDFLTVDLYKLDEDSGDYTAVCLGEPLVYGKKLWEDVYIEGKYPKVTIIPLDESNENTAVTYDNLNDTVFLTVSEE